MFEYATVIKLTEEDEEELISKSHDQVEKCVLEKGTNEKVNEARSESVQMKLCDKHLSLDELIVVGWAKLSLSLPLISFNHVELKIAKKRSLFFKIVLFSDKLEVFSFSLSTLQRALKISLSLPFPAYLFLGSHLLLCIGDNPQQFHYLF